MSVSNPGLFKVGQTHQQGQGTNPTAPNPTPGSYGTSVLNEGQELVVDHFDRPTSGTAGQVRQARSGLPRRCICVRNATGGVLLPGQVVNWASGYRGRRVGAKTSAAAYTVAGVVDPYLSDAGVADGDLFWLFFDGPCPVRFVAGAVTLDHGVVASATAGSAQTKGSAYAAGTDLGHILEAKTASASDPFVECMLKIRW